MSFCCLEDITVTPQGSNSSVNLGAIIGGVAGGCVAFAAIVLAIYLYRRKKKADKGVFQNDAFGKIWALVSFIYLSATISSDFHTLCGSFFIKIACLQQIGIRVRSVQVLLI